MRLSVVVVNWSSRDDLRTCLTALAAQSHRDLEVIVVDNGSTDGSADMVSAGFPGMRLLRLPENLGFAEGCNRGIAAATGPWIAMLNNDTVADPDWAARLAEAAEQAPDECGMLQSLMLFRDRPDVVNSTGIELTSGGGGRDRWGGRARSGTGDGDLQEIFCPTAGAAAYRRSMLDAVRLPDGYFDSEHFMYYEDLDLGWRARLAGWTAYYVPRSVVYHTWHGSADRHGVSWLEATAAINRTRTLIKNASLGFLVTTAPVSCDYVFRVARHGGWKGLRRLASAVRRSLDQRRHVARMARVGRRTVERFARQVRARR